jgi:FKBP-type peptidyl-prolyl cis-trans isomerase FklB
MSSCNNNGATKKSLDTELDSVSYAIGLNMAFGLKQNLKTSFDEADRELLKQGFYNAMDSTDMLMAEDKVQEVIQAYFQKKQQEDMKKQQEEAAKKAEEEFGDVKAAGEKFLEENTTNEGVEITASGLQYIVMKAGTGEKPTPTSKVKVHYHGTLTDGTVFDSSVDRGEPAQFGVGQVIPGWTEGLQLMSVGSKYKFFIPQELAYGATPRPGGVIKPFSALVFEVELLEIVN